MCLDRGVDLMTWLYILIGVLVGVFLLALLPMFVIARIIFRILLVRTSEEKWSRQCSWDDPEQQRMFDEGAAWGEKYASYQKRLTIESDGFKLVGEYFDFGHDKAVILIPGRMETCIYSYFFSDPYMKEGYNVLAIDNRSHGLSEGKYDTVGLDEYCDIIAWAKLLRAEHGIKSIVIHGMCIGAATAINALSDPEGKELIQGLVSEGVYVNFGVMLKERFIERGKPTFPLVNLVLFYIALHAHKSPIKFSPLNKIGGVEAPILFLYGKEDIYSKPENIEAIYKNCKAPKRLRMFDKGIHSHLRINAPEEYDAEVRKFLVDLPELSKGSK